jgi:two-component system, sensor histidine kinase and response regulator
VDVIDWNALKENCAGDEGLVREIIELFRREGPALLADVQTAVGSKEPLAIKRTAHRLKGALVSLAAHSATSLAKDLELAGSQNDLSRVPQLKTQLEVEMTKLMGALLTRSS